MITPKEIEAKVEEYNKRVYNGEMDEHSKSVLRDMIRKDDKHWERQWLHEELQAKHGEDRHRS